MTLTAILEISPDRVIEKRISAYNWMLMKEESLKWAMGCLDDELGIKRVESYSVQGTDSECYFVIHTQQGDFTLKLLTFEEPDIANFIEHVETEHVETERVEVAFDDFMENQGLGSPLPTASLISLPPILTECLSSDVTIICEYSFDGGETWFLAPRVSDNMSSYILPARSLGRIRTVPHEASIKLMTEQFGVIP